MMRSFVYSFYYNIENMLYDICMYMLNRLRVRYILKRGYAMITTPKLILVYLISTEEHLLLQSNQTHIYMVLPPLTDNMY